MRPAEPNDPAPHASRGAEVHGWRRLFSGGRIPLYLSLAIVAGLVGAYLLAPGFAAWVKEAVSVLGSDDEARIREWVEQYGAWGPALIVAVMTGQMFLIVVPSWALMVVAILAYGQAPGALLVLVAVAVASTVGYWVGRGLGETALTGLLGAETMARAKVGVARYGFGGVVVIRLAPFLSNDAVSFVAGMLGMRYLSFMAATLLGTTPLAVLLAAYGRSWEQLKGALLWISLVCIAAWLGWVVWRRRGSRRGGPC
jgi:uncharacterized membrane protein YdjX (TVP38/TMEM64 family)